MYTNQPINNTFFLHSLLLFEETASSYFTLYAQLWGLEVYKRNGFVQKTTKGVEQQPLH